MKSRLWPFLALAGVIVGCGKKHDQRSEVVECSSISLDAKGTMQCLVTLYHWKVADAQKAANARVAELDSLKGWRDDSIWSLDAAKHRRDVQTCTHGNEQLKDCLLVSGWPLKRVTNTVDSVWDSELPKHRRELQTCLAKRDFNLSSCLTLYYKWDSDRALATADSVTRARLAR
ncbi:MAG TPA: hypothetical protein VL549_14605 [Gemmatimonadales bacterium]|jgi:hypothetical protein|nr:hypothetical protein [Gemmatimonadales bacterium]